MQMHNGVTNLQCYSIHLSLSVQEILFLEVALTESWVILITRMAQGPDSGPFVWPSWQLVGAILGVDALATIFALFGWLSGPAVHGG